MQDSTEILIFSNCACVKPFQHKSEFGNILTLKTQNFFFAGVEYGIRTKSPRTKSPRTKSPGQNPPGQNPP